MTEEPLSSAESLRLIESMIQRAKNQFNEDGFLYLFWGWLILFCCIAEFILERMHFAYPWLIWLLTWVALAYHIIYIRRKRRKRVVTTQSDHFLGMVWIAYIIALFLMVVLGNIYEARGQHFWEFGNSLLLLLYGIPTFTTGMVLKFKPLWIGALGCWTLAMIAPFLPPDYHDLPLALAMIIAWIIPGYLLKVQHRKQTWTSNS
jgi:hypothetical protein